MKSYFDLKGRVAIVTGCSTGLGVQMAKALANQGAIIVPVARRLEKLQEVAIDELSEKLDSASYDTMEEFVAEILKYIRESNTENSILNNLLFKDGSLFSRRISLLLYNRFSDALGKFADENSEPKRDVLFAYISAGSAGIIDYWSQTGFQESEEAIASYILKLSNSTLKGLKL